MSSYEIYHGIARASAEGASLDQTFGMLYWVCVTAVATVGMVKARDRAVSYWSKWKQEKGVPATASER